GTYGLIRGGSLMTIAYFLNATKLLGSFTRKLGGNFRGMKKQTRKLRPLKILDTPFFMPSAFCQNGGYLL
ncbi:hypothetical protein, partial [Longicatena caecimuris]|uniref:hypothetical protein n=1 Tax=Longicatena caecimuris TaxID=1796635 RepID=UPI0039914C86